MGIISFDETSKNIHTEHLHINLRKQSISASMNAFKFIDKDTKQHVVYMPSFELSGYGETFQKANEMLKFSVNDLFDHLTSLPPEQMQIELSKLGWKKSMFNKEYSKAHVDINGELKNLNAENNIVERITLTAA